MRNTLRTIGLAAALLLPVAQAAAAEASTAATRAPCPERPWWMPEPAGWVGAEVHLSMLSNLVDQSTINLAFGYAGKGGYRWKSDWGAYFQVEQDLWGETEIETVVQQGVLNLGVGAERLFFQRRLRAALGLGPSILLYETALDERGTTGLYVDVRPTGIRWPAGRRIVLVLDPLTFTVEAPALGGIPLVQIQYRTAFGIEYGLGR